MIFSHTVSSVSSFLTYPSLGARGGGGGGGQEKEVASLVIAEKAKGKNST